MTGSKTLGARSGGTACLKSMRMMRQTGRWSGRHRHRKPENKSVRKFQEIAAKKEKKKPRLLRTAGPPGGPVHPV